MKKILLFTFSLLMLSIGNSQDFTTKWGNGYKLSSSDGMHSLKFGGRIMSDYAIWNNGNETFLELNLEGYVFLTQVKFMEMLNINFN